MKGQDNVNRHPYVTVHMEKTQTIVIGGGIIGLSIAWELSRRGQTVTVLERDRIGLHASRAAAGMLAAVAELGFEEFDLYALCAQSVRQWPSYARDLESDSGLAVDYRSVGTIVAARDRDAAAGMRRAFEFQREHDFDVTWLTRDEALDREPFLSPNIAAAMFAQEDHSVDNRAVVRALAAAIRARGGTIRENAPVREVRFGSGQPEVWIGNGTDETDETMVTFSAEQIVLAAGPWSRDIPGLPEAARPPVRPVKGQILELRMQPPFALEHVVRGKRAYLVPRSDGRLIVGATSEEMGFDLDITAGGLWSILDGAWELVPGIMDLPVLSTDVGLRPASRDHQPLIGWSGTPGLFVATGHYRHGIMLSAATAHAAADALTGGSLPELFRPFDPTRFAKETRPKIK